MSNTSEIGANGATNRHVKGRGAVGNPAGRFESLDRQAAGDGGPGAEADGHEAAPTASVATEVREERVVTAISFNASPDIYFDRSINPYRGCEHGCVYCYARPNHAYLGLSAGLDFERVLSAKANLVEALQRQLCSRRYRCEPVNIGAATDAYQPIERKYQLTRRVLELLSRCRHPVTIVTKSALIERDLDLLAELGRERLCAVFISITTFDGELARRWEPRAAAPWRRIETIRRLSEAGIPVGVLVAPIVPFLNDADLERILAEAGHAGARSAHYTLLRLPHELREVFIDWLRANYPLRADRVIARVRDLRGGDRLSESQFFKRMQGQGVWGELIRNRFRIARRRAGLLERAVELRNDLFRSPECLSGQARAQTALF